MSLPREVSLGHVLCRRAGPLEVLDLDLDEDVEEDAEDLEVALEAVGQGGEVLRYDIGAGVVDDRHLGVEGQLDQVENVAEALDPECDEAAPEVVVDSGGVLQPEDEDVLRQEVGVDEQEDLSLDGVLDDHQEEASSFRISRSDEPKNVEHLAEAVVADGAPALG